MVSTLVVCGGGLAVCGGNLAVRGGGRASAIPSLDCVCMRACVFVRVHACMRACVCMRVFARLYRVCKFMLINVCTLVLKSNSKPKNNQA